MRKRHSETSVLIICVILMFSILIVPLSACNFSDNETKSDNSVSIFNVYNVEVGVYKPLEIIFSKYEEAVTYSYNTDNIYIDAQSGAVKAMVASSSERSVVTEVAATTASGARTTFSVTNMVDEWKGLRLSGGQGSYDSADIFTDEEISVDAVNFSTRYSQAFPIGADVSMIYQCAESGAKYYNEDGVREDVFRILKNNGLNWTRLRLWVDPYDADGTPYGGGTCDYNRVLSMAKDAKAAGLKVLVDFHYSDFWAHPGQQIMPKSWYTKLLAENNLTVDGIANEIYQYTYSVITDFINAGVCPDMVQVGNEISSGMVLQYSTNTGFGSTKQCNYVENKKSLPVSLQGTPGSDALYKYIQAGINAVRAAEGSGDIEIMLHLARGGGWRTEFFQQFSNLDYDVIGVSYYVGSDSLSSMDYLGTLLNTLSQTYPSKKIAVAETSWGYTGTEINTSALKTSNYTSKPPISDYGFTVQGQAEFLRDIIAKVAALDNGYGVFWWEGAWTPQTGAGWAGEGSKSTWSNQAFFSYDGRVLPSLEALGKIR